MENKQLLTISPTLILLDLLGAVALALGIAKQFANVDILPASLQFEYHGLILIGAGVLLMLPMLLHVLSWARTRVEGTVIK